jgi:hypothetical protein
MDSPHFLRKRALCAAIVAMMKISIVSSFVVTANQIKDQNSFGYKEDRWNKWKIQELKSTIDENQPEIIASVSSESTSEDPSQQFELWLDLRQTTISPQAALLHLTNDLWDEYVTPDHKSFLVDKVLVNSMSENGMKKVVDDVRDEYEEEIEVLFQKDNVISSMKEGTLDDKSKCSINNEGEVFRIFDADTGKINVYLNPMPALEVISSGRWLVLDSSDAEDKSGRKEAIQSLVELSSGGLSASLSIGQRDDEEQFQSNEGGIVIDCTTSPDIFEAGALIKSLAGSQTGYVATESGILVQSSQNDDLKVQPYTSQKESNKYAILLPLDALLWKTASFVVSEEGLDV